MSEWYANGPLGLEQGFTISHAPAGTAPGSLTLALHTSGEARASLAPDRRSVTFTSPRGGGSLTYGALAVTDARGRSLPSHLSLSGGNVLVSADTRGARFPVRVDPLVQDGTKLTTGESSEGSMLGYSLALSGDGSTAVVGGPTDAGGAGAVWVFVRSNGFWVQQGPKLVSEEKAETTEQCGELEGEDEQCAFGRSVALSADGNTLIVGAPRASGACREESGECEFQGVARVFTRSGSTWSPQADLLGGPEESVEARFGRSVALSADGSTAIVGAPNDGNGLGAVWIFERSGSGWSQQGPKLLGGGAKEAHVGVSVSLSADGNTALAGGPGDSEGNGAMWVFERSGSSWGAQGLKLTGTGETANIHFGNSVALSGDGSTALAGSRDTEHVGAAWVFVRSGSGWAQQGERLTDTEAAPSPPQFGYSVALSGDGSTALIGGPSDDSGTGAAWLFTRSGSSWTQDGAKLTGVESPGGEPRRGKFGYSVALRADGKTALAGAPGDSGRRGAVWAFAEPALLPAVTGVTPSSGPLSGGTSVTIAGRLLAGATAVTFESAHAASPALSFEVTPAGSISAVAPPSPSGRPGAVYVRVTGPSGTSPATASAIFTYVSGAGGSSVSIDPAGTVTGDPRGALGGVLAFVSGCSPQLVSHSVRVGVHLRAAVRLLWRGSTTCRGRLTLRVAVKSGKHYRTKAITSSFPFALRPRKALTVSLKLNMFGRHIFRSHHGRLSASLLMARLSPATVLARTTGVRLLAQKPKPKHRK